jgi:ArsR family transcriptional regulator, arsenate/arsenite/antimonite-responsive transcriptional repressor
MAEAKGQAHKISSCVHSLVGIYLGRYMILAEIYRCLSDETRLRIMHLLARRSLCVCHFQEILDAPQVAVSKHLTYLRKKRLVEARRHEQWMIYSLPQKAPPELSRQLECLKDLASVDPVLQRDLNRLKELRRECDWVEDVVTSKTKGKLHETCIC